MDAKRCAVCGDGIEGQTTTGICYGCYLDTLIPAGHVEREDYEYVRVEMLLRARRSPATGLAVLDAKSGHKCVAVAARASAGFLRARAEAEAREGLADDEMEKLKFVTPREGFACVNGGIE